MPSLALVVVALLAVACEKAGPAPRRDAATVPEPDAARAPDARPPSPPADAAPIPPPRRRSLDGCETDDDCTTYGDPCGRGIFAVSKVHKERAEAKAQKACPGEDVAYLTTIDGTRTRCVRRRCRMANEVEAGGLGSD